MTGRSQSLTLLFIIFLGTVVACQSFGEFQLGEAFSLSFQETMRNDEEDIEIKFEHVTDYRCPVDVICVWEGNAEVGLSFSRDNQTRAFVLNTSMTAGPSEISLFGYKIQLIDLFPPNSENNPPDKEDYVARLLITQSHGNCLDNTDCPSGSYCARSAGDCSGTGQCHEKPQACIEIWDPVCGCDGQTYSNSCHAASAGVNVETSGECRDASCDDGTHLYCDSTVPVCSDYEILAIQDNCWICVNPATCMPWGEPACMEDKDCPDESWCNPCGTSSCPFCDDCVPACVPR